MSSFGERFRQLRKEKNLTQKQLKIDFNKKYHYNFTVPAISQYESNKRIPEIDALVAFCDYFDVSMDFLYGRSDIRKIDDKYKMVVAIAEEFELRGIVSGEEIKKELEKAVKLWKVSKE